jgi:hypothetical protein
MTNTLAYVGTELITAEQIKRDTQHSDIQHNNK